MDLPQAYQLKLLYAHEENFNRETQKAVSDMKGNGAKSLFSSSDNAYLEVGDKEGRDDGVRNEGLGHHSENEGFFMKQDLDFGPFTERAVPIPTPR